MTCRSHIARVGVVVTLAAAGLAALTTVQAEPKPTMSEASTDWRTDPAWHQGKAEWAVYEAQRVIYGKPRHYEATIFTNVQHMDPGTTTKARSADVDGAIPVFKHNVSEMIPTDNYIYRFLTTTFVRRDDMSPYKVVASSQEDCGSSYKQFVARDGSVDAVQFGYFPGEGRADARFPRTDELAFHDTLTLTLRDYPFEQDEHRIDDLALVADLTDNHSARLTPRPAKLEQLGRETLNVPYGTVDTHHLKVTHEQFGGATESHYWFAADPDMRRVLVQYKGPYGVEYTLKRLDWWAYWSEPKPK